MSFLKKNFDRLKNEGLKETFEVLELAFKKYCIDYCLIGARARDLWTDHIAFLNYYEGGVLYIGIDKKGKAVGVIDGDSDMLKIKGRLKNNISPS